MTQIYTSNTILVTPKATILNYTEGDTATLSAKISMIWVDSRTAQRILIYKWQESSNGIDWVDIPSGISNHPLSVNLATPTTLNSSLQNDLIDLELTEFNISNDKTIETTLEITNVLEVQNNYKYRCSVLLYNNTLSLIETVGVTDIITLHVVGKNAQQPINNIDIPWDPVNPINVINEKLILDHNSRIEIFNLNSIGCGTQWRVIEVGNGGVYLNGNMIDGLPVGLPKSYGPNTQSYPGYMELQFYCNDKWITQESWVSLVGKTEHVFNKYQPPSPVNIALNGKTIVSNARIGTINNPLVLLSNLDGSFFNTDFGYAINISGINSSAISFETFSQAVQVNPTSCENSIYGYKTVTIPPQLDLPVRVTITGGVDDNLIVNGNPIKPACSSAGPVSHTFVSETNAFTLAVADNYGVGVGYDLSIKFESTITQKTIQSALRYNTTNILTIDQVQDVKKLSVSSSQNWQNTGIYVMDDSRLEINANGSVVYDAAGSTSSPTGVAGAGSSVDSSLPYQSLIGRIGPSGKPFYIGDFYRSLANAEGYLELATNDSTRYDNSGSFNVSVAWANTDKLGVRVLKSNNRVLNTSIYDTNFDKLSLLVGYQDQNSIVDFSQYNRAFTTKDFVTSKDASKYNTFSGSYGDGGRSYGDSGSSLSFDSDFTIEGWFYFDVNDSGYQGLISTYHNSDATGWLLFLDSDNNLKFKGSVLGQSGWSVSLSSSYSPPKNQWVHIAVCRSGSTIRLFADGVLLATINSGVVISGGTKVEVGNYPYFNNELKRLRGYVNEIRVYKGVSKYSAAFPSNLPDNPFPKISYLEYNVVDLSKSQKAATAVLNNRQQVIYCILESKNKFIGPFNDIGQITLVYSYYIPYTTRLTLPFVP